MSDTAGSTLTDIQALLKERGVRPNNTENLNRAMLMLRGGPDQGFVDDVASAAAEGRPRATGTARPRVQPATPQTSTSTPQPAATTQDTAGGATGRGSGTAGGTASTTASPAAAVTRPPSGASVLDMDLLGEGSSLARAPAKPEGTKPQEVDIAGIPVIADQVGPPRMEGGSAQAGAAEAKRAGLEGIPGEPGQFNGIASPELMATLASGAAAPTMSPIDYALGLGTAGRITQIARAAPSLVGSLARSMGQGRPSNPQSFIPTTGQPMGPPAPTVPRPWGEAPPPAPPPARVPTAAEASAARPPQSRVPGPEAANAPVPPGMMPRPQVIMPARQPPTQAQANAPRPPTGAMPANVAEQARPFVPQGSGTPTPQQAMAPRPPTQGPARDAVLPPRNPTLAEASAARPPQRPDIVQANAARPPVEPTPAMLRIAERLMKSGMSRAEAMERATQEVAKRGASR